jgi:Skp family chaperone for outer membrane proteins
MTFAKLGWVVTTGLLGLMVRAGMQPDTEKVGYINFQTVRGTSQVMFKNQNDLENIKGSWQQMGDFVRQNPAFTLDQMKRFRELWTKDTRTPAEEAELTKLKTDAQMATKHFDDLRQKQSPTAGEQAEMNDLGKRALDDAQEVKNWQVDLNTQFVSIQSDRLAKEETELLTAIAQVAKAKGLTLVFSENAAAFGTIDITDDVRKAVDKNNK